MLVSQPFSGFAKKNACARMGVSTSMVSCPATAVASASMM